MINKMTDGRRAGFTIIELLVVIVVIAILAAISVVSYSGIQQRADDVRISATVNTYAKALRIYAIEYGQTPPAEWVCLGRKQDYPAANGFAEGQCSSGGANNMWSQSVMDALLPHISPIPNPLYSVRPDVYGGKIRGLIYDQQSNHVGSTNGRPNGTITYYIDGRRDCPTGIFREYSAGANVTMCNYVVPSVQ